MEGGWRNPSCSTQLRALRRMGDGRGRDDREGRSRSGRGSGCGSGCGCGCRQKKKRRRRREKKKRRGQIIVGSPASTVDRRPSYWTDWTLYRPGSRIWTSRVQETDLFTVHCSLFTVHLTVEPAPAPVAVPVAVAVPTRVTQPTAPHRRATPGGRERDVPAAIPNLKVNFNSLNLFAGTDHVDQGRSGLTGTLHPTRRNAAPGTVSTVRTGLWSRGG
jgi:hypothetical protein